MDSESNRSTSAHGSPVQPSRRLAVSSLLNTEDVTISFTPTNGGVDKQRNDSVPVDSPMEMDEDRTTPESDNDEAWANSEMISSRQGRRQSYAQAKQRKKQWTSEHVRELQRLYKLNLSWEDIAKQLGRTAVACKLKHNKELRRKAPLVMPYPTREPMHSSPAPYHLINDTIGTLSAMSHQIHDRKSTFLAQVDRLFREHESVCARAQQQGDSKTVPSIDTLRSHVTWEVEHALAAQHQTINDAWSALVGIVDQSRQTPTGLPTDPRPRL